MTGPRNATTTMPDGRVERRRSPTRPYAKDKTPSITTVLSAMSKPNLRWAAARETAIFAVERPDEWTELAHSEAIRRLAAHHDVRWGGAAAMGTLIHAVNDAWTWGEEVDLADLVTAAAIPLKRGSYQPVGVRAWKDRIAAVVTDAAGYVDGLERFWIDHRPETVVTEEVVRHMSGVKAVYIGQRDWIANIDGKRTLLEIKTSSRVPDPEKFADRLYLEEWRLQLAAQRYASHIVDYDDDGNEEGVRSNSPVDRCCVLHLCGDGDYGLWEVTVRGDEHGTFLRLVDVYHWWKSGHKDPPPVDLKASTAMTQAFDT